MNTAVLLRGDMGRVLVCGEFHCCRTLWLWVCCVPVFAQMHLSSVKVSIFGFGVSLDLETRDAYIGVERLPAIK